MNKKSKVLQSGKPVLVIGAAGVDIVGRLQGTKFEHGSNPAYIRTSFGGVARNVAENLARLGQEVIFIGTVGNDIYADQLLKTICSAGVNTDYVIRLDNQSTGMYIGVYNPATELLFALDNMEICKLITPEYIRGNESLIKNAACIFVDMNLSQETLRTIFTLAKRYHLAVCADTTSPHLAHKLIPYLPYLYLITPNAAEASALLELSQKITSRKQALLSAKALVSRGVDIVIITLGEHGLCYATSETSGYIPAIQTTIADPTGAGDALTAAVLFALLNDIPLDDSVRLGVSAATLTLQYPGSVIPDLTLEKLYDQLVI
ncbi:MAG: carbohydrate kinase family protein [Anaerolineales bacterium]